MIKLTEKQKREIRKIIDENRSLGGQSWKDYSEEEIIAIYGYFPSWANQSK
ncbi:MAG: hypothetical protein AAB456_00040 [Patescibacteria group bacterium]